MMKMRLFTKQKLTDLDNILMVTRGKGWKEGIVNFRLTYTHCYI